MKDSSPIYGNFHVATPPIVRWKRANTAARCVRLSATVCTVLSLKSIHLDCILNTSAFCMGSQDVAVRLNSPSFLKRIE
jgi:hypothetical protein